MIEMGLPIENQVDKCDKVDLGKDSCTLLKRSLSTFCRGISPELVASLIGKISGAKPKTLQVCCCLLSMHGAMTWWKNSRARTLLQPSIGGVVPLRRNSARQWRCPCLGRLCNTGSDITFSLWVLLLKIRRVLYKSDFWKNHDDSLQIKTIKNLRNERK